MNSSLLTCPRCNRELQGGSSFCPACGLPLSSAPQEARLNDAAGMVGAARRPRVGSRIAKLFSLAVLLAAGIGILVVVNKVGISPRVDAPTSPGSFSDQATTPKPEALHGLRETVTVGYWSYTVVGARWMDALDTGISRERPDARFLVISLAVRNNDQTSSVLPPVKLINKAGQIFDESSAGALSENFFGPLKTLNPGVTSRGLVAFDVPDGEYEVLLKGGFQSEETAKVDISAAFPSQTPVSTADSAAAPPADDSATVSAPAGDSDTTSAVRPPPALSSAKESDAPVTESNGIYRVGGGVSPPTVISSVDPEYSAEARSAKLTGIVVVSLIVDAQGMPESVHVVRPLGKGLDEKAIDAVRQYKFKPAMYQGNAVPVAVNIDVNFQVY